MEQEQKTLRRRVWDLGKRGARFLMWLVPQGQWYERRPRPELRDRTHLEAPWWQRPTEGQVLWTMRLTIGSVVLAGLLTLISYLFNIKFLDLLQLLVIPVVLAVVGVWFNRQQRKRELEIAERRAQDDTLKAYLDDMTGLMIDHHLRPSGAEESLEDIQDVRAVAQAHTVTVLRRLDGDRKASILRFLYEAGLITKGRSVLDLSGADLRKVSLRKANLREVDLSSADLREAYLNRADLSGANLKRADLSGAYLVDADLRGADLREASLDQAILGAASLSRAFEWIFGRFHLRIPTELYTRQEPWLQVWEDAEKREKRYYAGPHLPSSLQAKKESPQSGEDPGPIVPTDASCQACADVDIFPLPVGCETLPSSSMTVVKRPIATRRMPMFSLKRTAPSQEGPQDPARS